ncbi:MAG: thioredoxin family protein [Candidatus Hodarchaeales archaeon]|jgi:small redox-active disulfide protein 2
MTKRKIAIFGGGCAKCAALEKRAREAAEELSLEYEILKVTEMEDIVDQGVFKTPALGIDGKVVASGRVLSSKKIKELLAKE